MKCLAPSLPAGTKIREGQAARIPEWNASGGANQTELLENIDPSKFKDGHPIGDRFQ